MEQKDVEQQELEQFLTEIIPEEKSKKSKKSKKVTSGTSKKLSKKATEKAKQDEIDWRDMKRALTLSKTNITKQKEKYRTQSRQSSYPIFRTIEEAISSIQQKEVEVCLVPFFPDEASILNYQEAYDSDLAILEAAATTQFIREQQQPTSNRRDVAEPTAGYLEQLYMNIPHVKEFYTHVYGKGFQLRPTPCFASNQPDPKVVAIRSKNIGLYLGCSNEQHFAHIPGSSLDWSDIQEELASKTKITQQNRIGTIYNPITFGNAFNGTWVHIHSEQRSQFVTIPYDARTYMLLYSPLLLVRYKWKEEDHVQITADSAYTIQQLNQISPTIRQEDAIQATVHRPNDLFSELGIPFQRSRAPSNFLSFSRNDHITQFYSDVSRSMSEIKALEPEVSPFYPWPSFLPQTRTWFQQKESADVGPIYHSWMHDYSTEVKSLYLPAFLNFQLDRSTNNRSSQLGAWQSIRRSSATKTITINHFWNRWLNAQLIRAKKLFTDRDTKSEEQMIAYKTEPHRHRFREKQNKKSSESPAEPVSSPKQKPGKKPVETKSVESSESSESSEEIGEESREELEESKEEPTLREEESDLGEIEEQKEEASDENAEKDTLREPDIPDISLHLPSIYDPGTRLAVFIDVLKKQKEFLEQEIIKMR